jgi:hypothetical protein
MPHRHRCKFSLRTLLIVVTFAAPALTCVGRYYRLPRRDRAKTAKNELLPTNTEGVISIGA